MTQENHIVLVVDDSPDTLGMLNHALEQAGMTTLVALEGKQALSIASKMLPDIILLDAIMPVMDGFQTCSELRKFSALEHTPIIFMTGLSDTDSIVKSFESGGNDYLTKPINPIELIARMNAHLARASQTRSAREALEYVGQNVFSINRLFELSWQTPGAQRVLENINLESNGSASQDLSHWLARNPQKGHRFSIDSKGCKFVIEYVGLTQNDDHLLKIGEESQSESIALKDAFNITPRESEVLQWIAHGKSNREIAVILGVSPRTVNKHLEQVFKKLGVDNRTSAAAMALSHLKQ